MNILKGEKIIINKFEALILCQKIIYYANSKRFIFSRCKNIKIPDCRNVRA